MQVLIASQPLVVVSFPLEGRIATLDAKVNVVNPLVEKGWTTCDINYTLDTQAIQVEIKPKDIIQYLTDALDVLRLKSSIDVWKHATEVDMQDARQWGLDAADAIAEMLTRDETPGEYLFEIGDSNVGQIGLCARVVGESAQMALNTLMREFEDDGGLEIEAKSGLITYLRVYVNKNAITVLDQGDSPDELDDEQRALLNEE